MHPESDRFVGARLMDAAGWLEGRPYRVVVRVAPRATVRQLGELTPSGADPEWRIVKVTEEGPGWRLDVTPGHPDALPRDRHRRPEESNRGC
ncbi:MAG: hypothetical protein VKP57_05730 [Candidatus Sericytochromatia bacterium]|nr:hypothetical protein [Candidatus Sericytochromatia bacterium]